MRWIVSRSLRFRWLVLFAGRGDDGRSASRRSRTRRSTCSRSSRRRRSRSRRSRSATPRTRSRSSSRSRSRSSSTGSPGLDELRSKSVSQLSSIRLIFKRGTDELRARQLVTGARRAGRADAADLGQPAVDDAAALGDQPDHEDRAHLGRAEPDRDVVDRLLEDPAAPAARARGGAGRHLRRAAPAAPRAGRPGEAGRRTASRSTG